MTNTTGSEDQGPSWLEAIFNEAPTKNWCVRPYCTTCSADPFRAACFARAARRANIEIPKEAERELHRHLHLLSLEQLRLIFEEFVVGLRGVGSSWGGSDALRTVLIELYPPFLRMGVPESLGDRLAGSPAGAELQAMNAHSAEIREEAAERKAFQSPEAVEERRGQRQRETAERHNQRRLKTGEHNRYRQDLIEELEGMSLPDRLVWLAAREPGFRLEILPPRLFPEDKELDGLSEEIRRPQRAPGQLDRQTAWVLGQIPNAIA